MRNYPIADAHCDALYAWAIEKKTFSTMDVQPERMARGGVALQLCAAFSGSEGLAHNPYGKALAQVKALDEICEASGGLMRRVYEVPETFDAGATQMILSLEGGEILKGSIEILHDFKNEGACAVALTWNHLNELGVPASHSAKEGLTDCGKQMVREMRRLAIAADVSHLNQGGFYDVADLCGPFMATHSNARSLCDHTRNLTDEQIRILIEHQGFIGINFYTQFLTLSDKATLEDVVHHIDYIAQMGGIDILGMGSDFDGISTAPDGLQHPADFPNLLEMLEKRGYNHEALEKISGKNLLSFFSRVRNNT